MSGYGDEACCSILQRLDSPHDIIGHSIQKRVAGATQAWTGKEFYNYPQQQECLTPRDTAQTVILELIFPADLLTGANHPDFLTNHLDDSNKNYN